MPESFQSDEDAVNHLGRLLKNSPPAPMLLVLDDVWSGLESLLDKVVFKNMPEFKVLVTSRYEFPSFGSTYPLPLLKDEDAMTLFSRSAFLEGGSSYVPDEDVVAKVLLHCYTTIFGFSCF